jgi:hypothetical protein
MTRIGVQAMMLKKEFEADGRDNLIKLGCGDLF